MQLFVKQHPRWSSGHDFRLSYIPIWSTARETGVRFPVEEHNYKFLVILLFCYYCLLLTVLYQGSLLGMEACSITTHQSIKPMA